LTKNGEKIDPDDISAYIAGYSSDSSLYLARILKSLKIPQISYASTSIALSDQDIFIMNVEDSLNEKKKLLEEMSQCN
jgi:ABC-type branched-subunit amino acid transport system substrate-binding protein